MVLSYSQNRPVCFRVTIVSCLVKKSQHLKRGFYKSIDVLVLSWREKYCDGKIMNMLFVLPSPPGGPDVSEFGCPWMVEHSFSLWSSYLGMSG